MTRWLFAVLSLALGVSFGCSKPADPLQTAERYTRIVALAPNLTELVFAAGAGDLLVGVSAYSDYPPEALHVPVIGDAFVIDQEQLAVLKPDLLLAWDTGTPAHVIEDLRTVGYTVEVIRTASLDDVAVALRAIGRLTGHAESADAAARVYAEELRQLARENSSSPDIGVFYQVSARPLYTVNGNHYISELIGLCGGTNIFADLDELAPTIDVESVLERDPEVLLASTDAGMDAFDVWERWTHLAANRYQAAFLLPADEIGRATPRLVRAARAVCDALQVARARRAGIND